MGQALSRSEAREVAYRVIFSGNPLFDVLDLARDEKTVPAPEAEFIQRLVTAAQTEQAEIDAQITAHLKDWTLDRLLKTDLAALRLAVAEMGLGLVPVPVVINEAVNLAKKYGDEHSGAFVNGVLAQIAG